MNLVLSSNFSSDVSIQTAVGLLLVSLSIAFVVVGFLIVKFRFLDSDRYDLSRYVGVIMMAAGVILLIASILGIVHVNFFME